MSARFLAGAVGPASYPDTGLPEFAFYGKSNCGKSSLINLLTGRHALAKAGSRPGMTQQINFFAVNERFCLADLPGVGYAKLPEAERKALGPLVREYCLRRDPLRCVFYLLDLRREVGDEERASYAVLGERGIPVRVVGTKCDKLGGNELRAAVAAMAAALGVEREAVIVTSSSKKRGRAELLAAVEGCLA